MTTDEEYLDNLLKAIEQEEKEREKETQILQEKQIITDIDDYKGKSVEETFDDMPVTEADSQFDISSLTSSDDEVNLDVNTVSESASEDDWKLDLDELLTSAVEKLDESDDAFSETEMNTVLSENEDVTQYIDDLEDADDSLSEISELLKRSDNNETLDMFEEQESEIKGPAQEVVPEKKKNSFPWKKKKADSVDSDAEKKPKKERSFGRMSDFWQALVREVEENPADESETKDENDGNLMERENEDNEEKGRKKKEKKKKDKKKDKNKDKNKDNEAETEAGEEGEETGKGKKKRKKKEKKNKENPEATVAKEKPVKVLSRKSFMVLVAFCASLIAIIVCLSAFLPDYVDKRQAREAFYKGNYEDTFELLYGKKLNESDALLLDRVSVVLQMDRKLEAYYFHQENGQEAKALNDLLEGVRQYSEMTDKDQYGAGDEIQSSYQKILDILNQQYAMNEAEVLDIITYDDVRYSEKIYSVVEGTEYVHPSEEETEPNVPQDILPEEEDIIKMETENEGA